jgi:hypothetical protein
MQRYQISQSQRLRERNQKVIDIIWYYNGYSDKIVSWWESPTLCRIQRDKYGVQKDNV